MRIEGGVAKRHTTFKKSGFLPAFFIVLLLQKIPDVRLWENIGLEAELCAKRLHLNRWGVGIRT